MALITMEGFDNLLSGDEVFAGLGFNVSGGTTLVTGRFGGQALQLPNYFYIPIKSLPGNYASGFWGCALQFSSPGAQMSFSAMDAGSEQATIVLTAAGVVTAYRGAGGSPLGSTTVSGFNSIGWNYIELGFGIDPSAGTLGMRINGISVLSLTGQNTRVTSNSYFNQLKYSPNPPGTFSIDDFYFCDGTGSAPANTYLGDVRVQTLYPASAGTHTQWTPLASTNVSQVSEAHMDSDTSYNSSATPGQIDTFAVTALSGTPTIYGVRVKAAARKDDAGTRTVQTRIKSGATEQGGAANGMTSSYGYLYDQWNTDPSTSAAWTASGVNAMEIGYECVA